MQHAHTTLAYRCKEGPLDLPQGALPPHDSHPLTDDPTHDSRPTGAPTWQLACSEGRRHAAQREALLNVSAVMLEHYGPFVRREVGRVALCCAVGRGMTRWWQGAGLVSITFHW